MILTRSDEIIQLKQKQINKSKKNKTIKYMPVNVLILQVLINVYIVYIKLGRVPIPMGSLTFFCEFKISGHTISLGSTQPLGETSTRELAPGRGGGKAAGNWS